MPAYSELCAELSAPPLPPPLLQMYSAEKNTAENESDVPSTQQAEQGNPWITWYFQLLSPAFLCVLFWNSIEMVRLIGGSFAARLLSCFRCWPRSCSLCSRRHGSTASLTSTSSPRFLELRLRLLPAILQLGCFCESLARERSDLQIHLLFGVALY